ncbi:MAG: protein kinase [Myxococcales bacterium]|nr:protein kinase [Myxococcales bacterium]
MDPSVLTPRTISFIVAGIVLIGGGFAIQWWVKRLSRQEDTKGERAVQKAIDKGDKLKAARLAMDHKLYKRAAELFESQGRKLDAGRAWRKAEKWQKAADCFADAKDWDSAAFCLRHCDDDRGLLEALEKSGQFVEAAKLAVRHNNYLKAAMLLVKAGRKADAVEMYRKAGEPQKALELSAEVRESKGEWDAAGKTWAKLENWERALTAFEEGGDVVLVAKVLQRLGRHKEAAQRLGKGGQRAEAAQLLEQQGQFRDAARMWSKAGQVENAIGCLSKAGDRVAVVKLRAARGEMEEALRVAESVPTTDEQFAEAMQLAADLREQQGDAKGALHNLYRLLKAHQAPEQRIHTTRRAAELCVDLVQPRLGRVLLQQIVDLIDTNSTETVWYEGLRQQFFEMPEGEDNELPFLTPDTGGRRPLVTSAIEAEATQNFSEGTVAYVEGKVVEGPQKQVGIEVGPDGWPEGVPPSLSRRYSGLERLGQGGNGVVFRATDTMLSRVVVLKFMLDGAMPSDVAKRYFEREIKMAASLSHTNIVHIYDMGNEEGVPWYSMEYVEGLPLTAHLPANQPVTDRIFLMSVIEQISAALDHAHSRGMLHRDIKPDNILIAVDGTAKLLDFGLARAFDDGFGEQSVLAGTPYYMAPEQIDGSSVNHKADIYALGVILYRMFTGRLPFSEGNIFVAHALEPVPDPLQYNPDISPDVIKVIMHCLEKQPEHRPDNCGQVKMELHEALFGHLMPEADDA